MSGPGTARRRRGGHRWLLAIPLAWDVALIPVVNEVRWSPFDVPFPMVWLMAGVVVCTLVLRWVFVLDRRLGVEQEEAAFLASTAGADTEGRETR